MLCNAVGEGVSFPGKKRYEGVRFNIIIVMRGWVGVKFPGKKHYVTLEWPLNDKCDLVKTINLCSVLKTDKCIY